MATQIRKIYFDFDGVLAISQSGGKAVSDSLGAILKIPGEKVFEAFQASGKPFLLGQQSVEVFLKVFSEKLGKTVKRRQLKKAYSQVPINKPLLDLIKDLQEHFSIELVTNNTRFRFDTLREKGIIDVWAIFNKVHISSELKKFKDEFLPKLSDLENCLLIDNNQSFLSEIAKEGAMTIYYDSTKHDIGYLRKSLQSLFLI